MTREAVSEIEYDLPELSRVAEEVWNKMVRVPVVCLYGELGAGKTAFVRAVCSALGVKDAVSSPTFGLLNQYADAEGNLIYHADAYRLRNLAEAEEAGMLDALYSGAPFFLEWPGLLESELPEYALKIEFETAGETRRVIRLSYF